MTEFRKILVIGFGNMAGAMVDGWLASGIASASITAVDPQRREAPEGVRLLSELPDENFDLVLLGVKPQMLDDLAPGIEPLVAPDTVLLSILAGTEIPALATHFPRAKAIVRLMPNLAAALGKSANSLFAQGLDASGQAALTDLIGRLGTAEWLDDEQQFHAVTALAGSGPGFVYRFIDALAKGGADLGLDPAAAERLAKQMVEGAACLAAGSAASPDELTNMVASKGGTTEAGINVLDEDDALIRLVARCLRSASDRSREMAEIAKKNG